MIEFDIRGKADDASSKVAPMLAATATVASAYPDLRVEEMGDASANKALDDWLAADFRAAEFLSVPITLVILIVVGALLAAGIPVLLGLTSRMRREQRDSRVWGWVLGHVMRRPLVALLSGVFVLALLPSRRSTCTPR